MEKSGTSYSPPQARPAPSPNNPFRNPDALGAPPPPPYEAQISSSPYAGNISGNPYLNQGPPPAQRYPSEKSGSYQEQAYSYPQQQQFFPPPGAPNQRGGGYNSEYGPRSLDRDVALNYGGNNPGSSSHSIQGSYSPQQQYPQQPNQWPDSSQYQSPPGQYQSPPGQSRSFGSSPGVDPQHFDPNQPSSNRSGGGGGGILGKLGGKNPLDPPPQQFSRPPPGNYPYAMFPPMTCLSNGSALDDGWPILPPPAHMGGQHPFMSHDVTEEDWVKFLTDIKHVSSLTGKDRIISNGIPMAMGVSLIGGIFASRIIERRMKDKKITPVGDFIDAWNNCFFNPRRMNIVLAQNDLRFSGRIDAPPPDITGWGSRRRLDSQSDSDSDSDRSSRSAYDSRHGRNNSSGQQGGFLAAGIGRHGRSSSQGPSRKEARRARKADRRGRLHGAVGGLLGGGSQNSQSSQNYSPGSGSGNVDRHGRSTEKWRLVICFWDGRREVI